MSDETRTSLSIIVAMDSSGGIGINNSLPWSLREDLAHFKKTTLGRPVIMGRKTFDSIGRILPGRKNIVISRDPNLAIDGVVVEATLEGACLQASTVDGGEVFVIGGSEIFALAMPLVSRLVITEIHENFKCDTFFPSIDVEIWNEESRQKFISESGLGYSIVIYERS